jgi:hypothetical protein
MVYYRVALMTNQSPTWKWKSSVLTSLETLFNFLKIYRAIPKDRVRVFLSSTVERMDELLTRENNGLVSNSLTAEQLLSGYRVSSLEVTKLELELCISWFGHFQVESRNSAQRWSYISGDKSHSDKMCFCNPDSGVTWR